MGQLHKPAPLAFGDKVALIAPSGPLLHPERLDSAVEYLKSLGLEPVCDTSTLARYGYLAGRDHLRAHNINQAFADKDVKGIFCIRGGYGAARILDAIDYDNVRKNPKFFCGYSDITALHIAFNQQANLMTFHTPMVCEAGFCDADAYTLEYFNKCIFGKIDDIYIENPNGFTWEFLVEGNAEGVLCGGNLSVITSLMGTPYEIDTKGKVLFLEDIGEEPYRIDRMLTQLHLADKLKYVAGIIFGDFADCCAKDEKNSLTIQEIISNFELKIPIVYGISCGHCAPTLSLPLGAMVKLCFATKTLRICVQ